MSINRRNFLRTASMAGAAFYLAPLSALPGRDDRQVRLGIIGTGLRGREFAKLAIWREDTQITAICDIDPEAIAMTQKMIRQAGAPEPAVLENGETAFLQLLEREDVDAVIIATPWTWHVPMAVAAMKAGKFVGLEVSGASSLEECWELVNTFEETRVPCMILENVCYRRDVMAIMQMVRKGLFGELIHLEGGYQHDLRAVKFNDGQQAYGGGVEFGEKGFSEARWRTSHSVHRNGDLYPTHGLGPVATMLGNNRGNRFSYLTSMASKAKGLHQYVVDHEKGGANHPNAEVEFKLGDVVTTMIKAVGGETITLFHDTNLPRPYSLGFRVQGTKGLWMDVNRSIYIEGRSPESHRWEDAAPWLEKYDHPLWKELEAKAEGAGHGGMDYFVFHDFITSVKEKTVPPLDVYDAASWMAVTPLSEQSIARGSAPMPFPDFTNGKWMNRRQEFPLGFKWE